jgi:hypothetical protein
VEGFAGKMISRDLLIIGGAGEIVSLEGHSEEIWSLSVKPVPFSDRVYEFHEPLRKKPGLYYWGNIPKADILSLGLPLGNSICIMLANAIVERRFSSIRVLASPLIVGPEYTKERPALACCVWYANNIAGIKTAWAGGINFNEVYQL